MQEIRDCLRESFKFYSCRKNEEDGRGKHDKKYREERLRRIRENPSFVISKCSKCGATDCLLDDSTCTECGFVDGNGSWIQPEYDFHTYALSSANVYIPRFYTRERYNNFSMVCPDIDGDILQDILLMVWYRITGGRRRPIHSSEITRDTIYKSINQLYSKTQKRNLNLRERWLYIKNLMVANFDVFNIEDGRKWNCWFYSIKPTKDLIDRLVLQSSCLEYYYDEARPSGKKNRPNRDVIAIYLMYGYHPVLVIMYGWYWNIPATYNNHNPKYQRLNEIFTRAAVENVFMKWPSTPLPTIGELLSLDECVLEDELDYNTSILFPEEFLEKHQGTIVNKYSIMYDN